MLLYYILIIMLCQCWYLTHLPSHITHHHTIHSTLLSQSHTIPCLRTHIYTIYVPIYTFVISIPHFILLCLYPCLCLCLCLFIQPIFNHLFLLHLFSYFIYVINLYLQFIYLLLFNIQIFVILPIKFIYLLFHIYLFLCQRSLPFLYLFLFHHSHLI